MDTYIYIYIYTHEVVHFLVACVHFRDALADKGWRRKEISRAGSLFISQRSFAVEGHFASQELFTSLDAVFAETFAETVILPGNLTNKCCGVFVDICGDCHFPLKLPSGIAEICGDYESTQTLRRKTSTS